MVGERLVAGKLMGIGLLIMVGGLVALFLAYSEQRRDETIKSWPATIGHVVACEVVRTTIARLHAPASGSSLPPEQRYRVNDVWALNADYRYSVEGREYAGDRATSSLLVENIRPNGAGPSARFRAIAAKISVGRQIPVHFRPDDPSESYLVFIDSPGNRRNLQIGLLCIVLGAAIIVASRFHGA